MFGIKGIEAVQFGSGVMGWSDCRHFADILISHRLYGQLETIVFFALVALVVVPVSVSTIGQNRSGLMPKYVGMGLIFAGGTSNEGEIALLGHATDFLYIRFVIFSYHQFFIANLADIMIFIGFILIIVTPTYQKFVAEMETSEPSGHPMGELQADEP